MKNKSTITNTYSRISNHHRLVVDIVHKSFTSRILRIAKILTLIHKHQTVR